MTDRSNLRTRSRRHALQLIGGAGLGVAVAACSVTRAGDAGDTSTSTGGTPSSTPGPAGVTEAVACSTIPEETDGPFPADGSNGVNVLTEDGVVRSDISSSFGSSTTVADGVPLALDLQVVDTADGCRPREGAALYVWHCDRDGNYSMYRGAASGENYLRGVQVTDEEGRVQFTTIFPGCYSGRWPHVHFEVYPDVDSITDARNKLATSQLAFPADICDEVYATAGYSTSVRNMSRLSITNDSVFRDGVSLQTPTMTGQLSDGLVAGLVIPV